MEEETEALINNLLQSLSLQQAELGFKPRQCDPRAHPFLSTTQYSGLTTSLFLTSFLSPTASNLGNKVYFLLLRPF